MFILRAVRHYLLYLLLVMYPAYALDLPAKKNTDPILFTPEELQWIEDNPTVHACVENDWAPFSYTDINNKLVGLSKEFLDALADFSGLNVVYHSDREWKDILQATKEGKCDILNGLYFTRKRSKYINYTAPYLTLNEYFYTKEDMPTIYHVKELENKTVALVKGYATTNWIKENYPKIKILEKSSISECLYSVLCGESEAFIGDNPSTNYNIEKNLITGIKLNNSLRTLKPRKLFMGTKKSYGVLASILSKSIMCIDEEKKRNIKAKWINISNRQIINLDEDEERWLKSKPTISYTFDPDWKPFEWKNSLKQHQGVLHDIIKIVEKRSGIHFVPTVTDSWSESIEKVKSGKVSMFTGIGRTEQRESYLYFSNLSLYSIPYIFTTRVGDKSIYNFTTIKDKKVATLKNSTIAYILEKNYPNLKISYYDTTIEGLDALKDEEIDVFIVNQATAKYYIDFKGYQALNASFKTPFQLEIKLAFNSTTPIEAIQIINKTLQTLTERELNAILHKWTTGTIQKETNWKYVWIALFIAFLVAVFFIFINRRLKYLVNKKTAELKKITEHLEEIVEERTEKLNSLNEQLAHIANIDPMTQIYNRRYFFNLSDDIVAEHRDNETPLSIAMADIDLFKKINDTHGHDIGDKVILHVVECIKDHLREKDILVRFGGEEFLILFPATSKGDAIAICQEICGYIDRNNPMEELHTTISIGVSEFQERDKNINLAIKRADVALYKAKESGRNRVISD